MVNQIPEDDTGPDFKSRAMRDREDLHLEIAGLQAGRQARFLVGSGNSIRAVEDRRKKEEEQRFYSVLDMLLRDDPRYSRLHHEVSEKLERARQAVDLALIDIKQRQEAAVRQLQKLRDSAGRLPDGTRVFRSSTGNGVYNEHGHRLNDAEAQRASIPDGAPSWEDYQAAQATEQRQREEAQAVERYRDEVVRPAQERLNNADDPPSMDELAEISQRLDRSMPAAMSDYVKVGRPGGTRPALSAAHVMAGATNLAVPDLTKDFDSARAEVPAIADPPQRSPAQPVAPR